ncbi:MAG: hypothetical protein Q8936_01585 [Bacillota bacterium]|nr:hypothetical protein [Bacillota bacterium]
MKVIAKPVEMVAWFDEEGTPHPMRFRITTEDESKSVIKIHRVLFKNEEKLAGKKLLVFKCQAVIQGVERILELKYETNTCKWILFKI